MILSLKPKQLKTNEKPKNFSTKESNNDSKCTDI